MNTTKYMTKLSILTFRNAAIVLAVIAIALIVAGFIVPPMGEVHPSVLKGVGEIIGIIAIFFGWESVDKGLDAKIQHGKTTIQLGKDLDNKEVNE